MSLEIFSISINLALFCCLIYKTLAKIKELKAIFSLFWFYLTLSFLFYLFFYFNRFDLYKYKEYFFHYISFLGALTLFLISLGLPRKIKTNLAKLSLGILSIQIYFVFFGMEEFVWFDKHLKSFKLLKSQNPVLAIVFFLLLLPRSSYLSIGVFLFFLGGLFYFYYDKQFTILEEPNVYQTYIPCEFFFTDDHYIKEESYGVYVENVNKNEEQYYKFHIHLAKEMNMKYKQKFFYYISHFEFPILLKTEEELILLDISRTLYGEKRKISFRLNTEKITLEGPIF
jgi:hypothetical protein